MVSSFHATPPSVTFFLSQFVACSCYSIYLALKQYCVMLKTLFDIGLEDEQGSAGVVRIAATPFIHS
jgi:hypothetical protein